MNKDLFFQHIAQTSHFPLLLEIVKGEGIYLYDNAGKRYTDLISGIAVSNLGHRHPAVLAAIKHQMDSYLHLMVYGEYVQSPQVKLASMLASQLPTNLQSVYFVNSGSEAIEGAMKLAKRYTGRTGIISFKNAYHGSTHGALSICGEESLKQAYRPLLPDIQILEFNSIKDISAITQKTACVVMEPIQGEAGVIPATAMFLDLVRSRCNETGTLLIFDEIQTGYGRTGNLFAFQGYNVIPDILCLAKGMGGGLPLGAFISSRGIMECLKTEPVLGHITTFGGNALSCAASLATLNVILNESLYNKTKEKGELFRRLLKHPSIKEFRGVGLMIALEFQTEEICLTITQKCLEKGLITDWFLFARNCMRIAPPLIIEEKEIIEACDIIICSINEVMC